jgi:hypothetical protein
MLLPPHPHLSYFITNDSDPTATAGTSVTSHSTTANAYGTWTQIHAGLTYPSSWVQVNLTNNYSNNTTRNAYVDIGIGPNSGAVTTIVEKLCGTGASNSVGRVYFMPLRIPPDTPVWARHQNTAANTIIGVQISVQGGNMNPGTLPYASEVVCLGASTGTTIGTSISVGASGAEGSWTQIIASSTEEYAGLMVGGIFTTDTSLTASGTYCFDIGLGANPNEFTVGENVTTNYVTTASESISSFSYPSFIGVKTGERIVVRGSCSGTADSSLSVVVYGFKH